MPKTRRDVLKRRVAQAYNNVDRALANVRDLHDQFDPVHPEYGEFLVVIGQTLTQVHKLLMEFWVHAWGELPDDIETWMR